MTARIKNNIFVRAHVFFVLVVAVLMLTGCGASLTVYDYVEDGVRYNDYELTVDSDTVELMERTAIADEYGKQYTVSDYFYEFFTGYGCELVSASMTDEAYTVRFRKAYYGETDLFEIGSSVVYEYEYTQNPFVRDITAVSPNPFNGVREAYDNVRASQSGTLIQQIKNGKVAVDEYGEPVTLFPSIQTAFPYLKGMDPSGLLLSYARNGSSRMKSSGVSLGGGRTRTYVFSRYFDCADTEIVFRYKRPVPYGWYIVAVAAGGIVIAAIVLATRPKKKKKQDVSERFPYNPEDYSGGNLPM